MNYHTYSLNPNEINDWYVHKSSSRDRKPNNLISSVFDWDRRENYYKSNLHIFIYHLIVKVQQK